MSRIPCERYSSIKNACRGEKEKKKKKKKKEQFSQILKKRGGGGNYPRFARKQSENVMENWGGTLLEGEG